MTAIVLSLVIMLMTSQSIFAAQLDQTSYSLGDSVIIRTTPGATGLVLHCDGQSYKYLGTPDATIAYKPSMAGACDVEETQSDGTVITTEFYVVAPNTTNTAQETVPLNLTPDMAQGIGTPNAQGRGDTTTSGPSAMTNTTQPLQENVPSDLGTQTVNGLLQGKGAKKQPTQNSLADDEVALSSVNKDLRVHTARGTGWIANIDIRSNGQRVRGSTLDLGIAPTISKSPSQVSITFDKRHVKEIDLQGADASNGIDIGMDEIEPSTVDTPLPNKEWVAVYAIDPSNVSFTTGDAIATASGTELYKCKDWDFYARQCNGTWAKVMDLTPGTDYQVALSASDPGFAESIVNYGVPYTSDVSNISITASVPTPLRTTANEWGVTVFNPTNRTISVSTIVVNANQNVFGTTVTGIKPTTGWTRTAANTITWTGSYVLSPVNATDFIFTIAGANSNLANAYVMVNATTNYTNLTNAGYVTQTTNGALQYCSVYFVNDSNGASYAVQDVAQNLSDNYTIRLDNGGGTSAVNIGTSLLLFIPPGWTNISAAAQTGWTTYSIMGDEGSGWVLMPQLTNTIAAGATLGFVVNATPPDSSDRSVYQWNARLLGQSANAARSVSTTFEPALIVANATNLLTARDGLYEKTRSAGGSLYLDEYAEIASPFDSGGPSRWGVVVVNPTDNPVNVTQVDFVSDTANLFGSVTPILPANTWSLVSATDVRWTGNIIVQPHAAAEFAVGIAAVAGTTTRATITVSSVTSAGTLSYTGFKTGQSTGVIQALSVYAINRTGGAAYLLDNIVPNATASYTIRADNSGASTTVPAGTELEINIPPGWTNISAGTQTGWVLRQVRNDPVGGGSIRAFTTTTIASGGTRDFIFNAAAPVVGTNSTYRFDTLFFGATGQSVTFIIQAQSQLALRVVPASYGINLVRKSSPATNISSIASISLLDIAAAYTPTWFNLTILNAKTGGFATLRAATLGTADEGWNATLSINRTFDPRDYINANASSPDLGKIVIRWYTPSGNQTILYEDYLSYNTTLDTTPPAILPGPPGNASYIGSLNVMLQYNASDNTDLRNCSLYINGTLNATDTAPLNGTNDSFQIYNLPDRKYNWSVLCYDLVGNVNTSANYTFTVDTTFPTALLNAPGNNSKNNTATVTFAYTPVDINLANCSLYIDQALNATNATPLVSGAQNTIAVAGIGDGGHNWTVGCADLAGNTRVNQTVYWFSIDTVPPAGTNMTAEPASPAVYSPLTIYRFNTSWTDLNNISKVIFETNITGQLVNYTVNVSVGSTYSYNWTPIGAGSYVWRMYANDTFNNWNAVEQQTCAVSPATSGITLLLNGTAANYPVDINESVNITGIANTPGNGYIELYVNGARVAAGNGRVQNIASFPTNGSKPVLLVFNATQNYTAANVTFNIVIGDKAGPTVNQSFPLNNTFIDYANITFLFNLSDQTGTDSCSIYINGTLNATKSGMQNNQPNSIGVNGFAQGNYSYFLSCNDTLGNRANSTRLSFAIDLTPPAAFSLASPTNGTVTRNQTPTLAWTQSGDTYFKNYTILLSKTADFSIIAYSYNTTAATMTSFGVPTPLSGDNLWYWEVIAYDLAGNSRTATPYQYPVDINPPVATIIAPQNDTYQNITTVNVTYTLADFSPVQNCTLRFNDSTSYANTSGGAQWWNYAWQYRKAFVVTERNGTNLDNFQINISVDTASLIGAGKMKADCSDLRIIYRNVTALPIWIQGGCGIANTSVWFTVNLTASQNETLQMYYGNNGATGASNGSAVFDFFDDFSGDLGKWDDRGGANITIASGILNITGGYTTGAPYGWADIGSNTTYAGFQDGIIEYDAYLATNSIAEASFRGNRATNTGYKARTDTRAGNGISFLKPPYNASTWNFITAATTTPCSLGWNHVIISVNGSTMTLNACGQTKTDTDASYAGPGEISLQNHYGAYSGFDNVFVHKFAQNMPVAAAMGAEDTPSGTNSFIITKPEGNYLWNLTCTDIANNTNTTTNSLLVIDTTPPTAVTMVSPANMTFSNNNEPDLVWMQTTEANFRNYTVLVSDNSTFPYSNASYGTYGIANTNYQVTNPWPDGTWYWKIVAWDLAGNSVDPYFEYTIDATPPTAFDLVNPADGTSSAVDTPLLAWQQSNDTNFANYTILVSTDPAFGTVNYTYATYDSANTTWQVMAPWADNAIWYWKVMAEDNATNTRNSTSVYSYTIDNQSPVVTLISPGNGTNYRSNTSSLIAFIYNVTDLSHIVSCTLSINDSVTIQTSTDYFVTKGMNQTFPFSLSNGDYNWSVSCTDAAENSGTSKTYALSVNVTLPRLRFYETSPYDSPQTNASANWSAMAIYANSTSGNGSSMPDSRVWNGVGWGPEIPMPSAGSPVRWVKAVSNPLLGDSKEKIAVTLSNDGYLDAYVWNGSAWSVTNDIGYVGTTSNADRSFDIGYETQRGRGMLVFSNYTNSACELAYRIWNGSGWTPQGCIDDPSVSTATRIDYIRMASNPNDSSNELAIAYIDATNAAGRALIWNGSTWGTPVNITTALSITTEEDIGIEYEQQSYNILAVAGTGSLVAYTSYSRSAGIWSAPRTVDINPGATGTTNYLRLKANPAGNDIMILGVDGGSDLSTALWSGGTWSGALRHDAAVDTNAERPADFEWDQTGSTGLLAWGTTAGQVDYKSYSTSTLWSAQSNVPAGIYTHPWVMLRRIPDPNTNDGSILGATEQATSFALDGLLWTNFGTLIDQPSALTAAQWSVAYQGFDIVTDQYPPTTSSWSNISLNTSIDGMENQMTANGAGLLLLTNATSGPMSDYSALGVYLPQGSAIRFSNALSATNPGISYITWQAYVVNASGEYLLCAKGNLGRSANATVITRTDESLYTGSCMTQDDVLLSQTDRIRVYAYVNSSADNTITKYVDNIGTYAELEGYALGNLSVAIAAPTADPLIGEGENLTLVCSASCAGGYCLNVQVMNELNDTLTSFNATSYFSGNIILNASADNPVILGSINATANATFQLLGDEWSANNTLRCTATSDYANATSNLQNVTVLDKIPPNVTLASPTDNGGYDPGLFTFTFLGSDRRLGDCSLWGNWSGNWRQNQTVDANNGSQTSFAPINISGYGTYRWNVNCSDLAGNMAFAPSNFTFTVAGDIYALSQEIAFSPASPVEGANVTVSAIVRNKANRNESGFNVSFYDGDPRGTQYTQIGPNITVPLLLALGNVTVNTSMTVPLGLTDVFVVADSPWGGGIIFESNKSNNIANNTVQVSMWQTYDGNTSANVTLGSASNSSFGMWFIPNITGNIYVSCTDTTNGISFPSLLPMGRNTTLGVNGNTADDFAELDTALNTSAFPDSVNATFTAGGAPVMTDTYTLYGRSVPYVPIVNSTPDGNLTTGLLWDSSDATKSYYNIADRDDVVFVTKIRKGTMTAYGAIDYAIKIPSRLKGYKGSGGTVTLYYEIQ